MSIDPEFLRDEIRKEYGAVASDPARGYHYHIGRDALAVVEYDDGLIDGLPEASLESFAGTGNPFSMGWMRTGERVVDLGCGAGTDSLIAGRQVGPTGAVLGIDMTGEMIAKAVRARDAAGLVHVAFEKGLLEKVPAADGWANAVISNGVINLCMDKTAVFAEIFRLLRPGGRMQVSDIIVEREVPEAAKKEPHLWTG
jgi:SAM-dependent methyltransferase